MRLLCGLLLVTVLGQTRDNAHWRCGREAPRDALPACLIFGINGER